MSALGKIDLSCIDLSRMPKTAHDFVEQIRRDDVIVPLKGKNDPSDKEPMYWILNGNADKPNKTDIVPVLYCYPTTNSSPYIVCKFNAIDGNFSNQKYEELLRNVDSKVSPQLSGEDGDDDE